MVSNTGIINSQSLLARVGQPNQLEEVVQSVKALCLQEMQQFKKDACLAYNEIKGELETVKQELEQERTRRQELDEKVEKQRERLQLGELREAQLTDNLRVVAQQQQVLSRQLETEQKARRIEHCTNRLKELFTHFDELLSTGELKNGLAQAGSGILMLGSLHCLGWFPAIVATVGLSAIKSCTETSPEAALLALLAEAEAICEELGREFPNKYKVLKIQN